MYPDLPRSGELNEGWLQSALRPVLTLLQRRQLFVRLLEREVESAFRGSALGLFWIVLVPLVMVTLYTFVFGVVMKSSWVQPTASPFEVPLIYFCGLSIAGFFMEVLNRSPNHIRSHTSYVKKVIFPLELLPGVLVGTALIKLGIGLGLLGLVLSVVKGRPAFEILAMPILLLPFVFLMLGLSWIISAIGTYVRDLGHILAVVSPLIMFVSPVFYTLEQVPEVGRPFYWANPLTFILENARRLLFLDVGIDWGGYALYWLVALVIFSAGYRFFARARPGFADVV